MLVITNDREYPRRMDLLEQISERQEQFFRLHNSLETQYARLKSAYEAQQEKLANQKLDLIEQKWQANFWHARFEKAKSREQRTQSRIRRGESKIT